MIVGAGRLDAVLHHPYLDGPRPCAYAHRGWHIGDLAGCENTLAGFVRAVREGFRYLEMDVHATADEVPVVHHDLTLDRVTDATGLLADRTAAELARVRVRGREPIPLLADVLETLPDVRMTIELKSDAVVEPVLALLERTDSWHRVCLGSFYDDRLDRARAIGGDRLMTSMAQRDALALRTRAWLDVSPLSWLPRPALVGRLAQLPPHFGPLTVVDAALVHAAHAAGRSVHVWTVDDPVEMHRLLDLGVDGLLSDRPDRLRSVLRERGQWNA